MGPSLQTILPLTALNRAIAQRPPSPGLVHHSDRGTQYASNDYVRRLEECQITISMSRPARPWENARCERFMRTLKEEEIDCREYSTLQELERNLEDSSSGTTIGFACTLLWATTHPWNSNNNRSGSQSAPQHPA